MFVIRERIDAHPVLSTLASRVAYSLREYVTYLYKEFPTVLGYVPPITSSLIKWLVRYQYTVGRVPLSMPNFDISLRMIITSITCEFDGRHGRLTFTVMEYDAVRSGRCVPKFLMALPASMITVGLHI